MNLERALKHLAAADDPRAASDRLVSAAAEASLVDVAVASMDSPVGELRVAVTPRGLAAVSFEGEEYWKRLLQRLARDVSPRILEAAAPTDEARRELEEYFDRGRTRFDLKIDRRLISDFSWDVLRATRRVGFGHTATYGQIAAKIGKPKAARAVGRALGANPIPIVIPCHRIVGSDGRLTGYAGGLPRKERLLTLEGVTF